jgi:hypothetical protein
MINILFRKKFGLSYSLMLTILGVFLLNLFCEIGIEPTAHKASASTHHSDNHSHDDGGHSGDHDHNTHGDDNCCGDVTSQFFSQLIKEKVPSYTFQSATKVFLIHAPISFTENEFERNFSQLRYYHNLPPPFQDHSKQILFQTFLI